ncbi:SDR family oxidoreductase, partial [Nocardia nova]|uniref:type I polyketide synthase n=1 Tax=Nocardia nova TaxID=37330 RepID=UPI001C43C07E
LIDLPFDLDIDSIAKKIGMSLEIADEDEIAIRDSGMFARRLVRVKSSRFEAESWVPTGTAVVTGGTGRIGSSVARWLAELGVSRLLLLSRSGMNAPGADELRHELSASGAVVDIVACDVANHAELQRVWDSVEPDFPISAVFHTAAVLDDAPIDALTSEQIDRALAVKAGGARSLHELAGTAGVEKFVVFSSLGATLGAAGQGNYAPGNAYLDALADHRRGSGLAGVSMAWGAWAGGGMAAGDAVRGGLQRHGVIEMEPDLTLAGLGRTLGERDGNITFAQINWDKLVGALRTGRKSALVRAIPEVAAPAHRSETDSEGREPNLTRLLASMDGKERKTKIAEIVGECLKSVLGYQNFDEDRTFKDLGADSLSSVQLRNVLWAATGLTLSGTLIFDYPTPLQLVEHVDNLLGGSDIQELSSADILSRIHADIARLTVSGASIREMEPLKRGLAGILAEMANIGNDEPRDRVGVDIDSATADELFEFIDNAF